MGNQALKAETGEAPTMRPIDYAFRPGDYWGIDSIARQVLSRIAGSVRRDEVECILETEGPDGLERLLARDPNLLDELLEEKDRDFRARIHPKLMGGEYLPRLKPDEVEIARVELLASVLNDVIRVTARSCKRGIRFAVQNEYPEFGRYRQPFFYRRQPLSLGELVELIDHSAQDGWRSGGLVYSFFDEVIEGGPATPRTSEGLVQVRSVYYPELGEHYRRSLEARLEEWRK